MDEIKHGRRPQTTLKIAGNLAEHLQGNTALNNARKVDKFTAVD